MNKQEKIAADFHHWRNLPVPEDFSKYEILGDKILVRLYYYDADRSEKRNTPLYVGFDSEKTLQSERESQLFPIGKVMAVGNGVNDPWDKLKPGDLVTVMDHIAASELNKEWVDFQALTLEKPGLKDKMAPPEAFRGVVANWKGDVFVGNKFKEKLEAEDAFTFLLNQRYILTKYND